MSHGAPNPPTPPCVQHLRPSYRNLWPPSFAATSTDPTSSLSLSSSSMPLSTKMPYAQLIFLRNQNSYILLLQFHDQTLPLDVGRSVDAEILIVHGICAKWENVRIIELSICTNMKCSLHKSLNPKKSLNRHLTLSVRIIWIQTQGGLSYILF